MLAYYHGPNYRQTVCILSVYSSVCLNPDFITPTFTMKRTLSETFFA